jgi:hypothetical protein
MTTYDLLPPEPAERERAQRAVKDDLQAMAEVHASLYRPRPPMRRPLLVFALWAMFSLIFTGMLVAAVVTSQAVGPLAAVLAAGMVTIWGTEKWS